VSAAPSLSCQWENLRRPSEVRKSSVNMPSETITRFEKLAQMHKGIDVAPHFSRVEVFSYIEHPLRTRDGIALHAHLCAVADKQ
jgi:hypothetical protein